MKSRSILGTCPVVILLVVASWFFPPLPPHLSPLFWPTSCNSADLQLIQREH